MIQQGTIEKHASTVKPPTLGGFCDECRAPLDRSLTRFASRCRVCSGSSASPDMSHWIPMPEDGHVPLCQLDLLN